MRRRGDAREVDRAKPVDLDAQGVRRQRHVPARRALRAERAVGLGTDRVERGPLDGGVARAGINERPAADGSALGLVRALGAEDDVDERPVAPEGVARHLALDGVEDRSGQRQLQRVATTCASNPWKAASLEKFTSRTTPNL